jgi:hypothetical protein
MEARPKKTRKAEANQTEMTTVLRNEAEEKEEEEEKEDETAKLGG